MSALDPTAADNDILPKEDRALPGRHRTLRCVKFHDDLSVLDPYGCKPGFKSISNLDFTANRAAGLFNRDPVCIPHRESAKPKFPILPYDDTVRLRFDLDDVLWPSCGNQSLALSD